MRVLDIPTIQSIIKTIGLVEFYQRLIMQLEQDFMNWHKFYKSPRHAIHYDHGVIELMPCSDDEFYSFKYVNGHPCNTENDHLCVVAMGMLADVKSGYPLILSEMTILTAIRTAAVAAMGAKLLARRKSKKLAIIGCGAQSEFQVKAMQSVFPITHINAFDIDVTAMHKFHKNLSTDFNQINCCNSAVEAISDADIIITATAANKHDTLFTEKYIAKGTHIHAMGGYSPGKTELGISLLKHSKLIVEFSPQSLLEGEIQQLNESHIHAELWQILKGEKKARENDNEITIFDSVGFAVEDYSVLKLIYEFSTELNLGTNIDLIPDLDNPKDLYSLIL